jgi:hypothetical protein
MAARLTPATVPQRKPGWQSLGVIHHDQNHRGLNPSAGERTHIYDAIAAIDWSRTNKEWVDEAGLGQWAIPKGGTNEQVVILGAGAKQRAGHD